MNLKFVSSILLSVCVLQSCLFAESEQYISSDIVLEKDADILDKTNVNLEEEEPLAETSEGVVDRVSLFRNYLAAQLNEYEGETAEAAFYYNLANQAYPNYKPLQDKAFSMQLLAGDWEHTARLARSLHEGEDPLPLSVIVLAVEELRLGNIQAAQKHAAKAVSTSKNIMHLHIINAYLRLALGEDPTVVLGEMRDLPYSPLMSPVKHYHLGNMFMLIDDLEQAELEYTMAYEQDNKSLFAIKGLVSVLQARDRQEKLKELFEKFFKDNPENIMMVQAKVAFEKGDLDSLLVDYDTATGVADTLFNFATLLSSQNASFSAHQILNMAIALNANNNMARFYKGILFEQEELLEEAYHAYSKVEEGSHVYTAAQLRLSGVLQIMEKYDDAISIVKNLQKKNDLELFNQVLAELYFSAERYNDAISLYTDVLNRKKDTFLPKNSAKNAKARAYFARGSAYERLLKYDEAAADLKKSIDLQPNNATALNYLGYMLIDLDKDIEYGMSLVAKALILQPNDSAILDSMGWAWYKSGAFDKALVFLERAIAELPEDPTINMHLGQTYQKLGQKNQAILYFDRALKIGPETQKDKAHIEKQLIELSGNSE